MDIESKSNWRLWCRLCTKDNATNITNILLKVEEKAHDSDSDHQVNLGDNRESMVVAIAKYFSVDLRDEKELPKSLCSECFTFVKTLLEFGDRVVKAQKLFCTLQTRDDIQYDSNALRIKYGLLKEDAVSDQHQLLEVHYFDTKPEANDVSEENIFEPETVITDPLEVPKLKANIKTEKADTDKVVVNEIRAQENHSNNLNIVDENRRNHCRQQKKEKEEKTVAKIKPCSRRKGKIHKRKASFTAKRCKSSSSSDSNTRDEDTVETTVNNAESEKNNSIKTEATQSDDLLTCETCSMKFKRTNIYQKHMKEVHNKEVPKGYACPHCSRVFQQPYKLRKHLLVHKPIESRRVVPCPHCDKKFTSANMVEFHINYIHKDLRPYVCEECGETCRLAAELKSHILTHTDYAPFQCEICQNRFKEQSRLKKHMHIHDPIKPICMECGLQFSTRFTLKRHMLVHSNEMQHKCDYCGRAFKRGKTLKNHLVLHAGLKPYTCNFCDRTFASGANCRTHKKRAHPEELAALEAKGTTKTSKLNIPKLKALKALTKTGENLLPVVSKQSGCFAKDHANKRLSNANSSVTECKLKEDLQPFMQAVQYINSAAVTDNNMI